ncbi:MAG: class I SAM-dependent methyltransferase [Gemmataceae bacterium]
MGNPFEVHRVEWTREKSSQWWNVLSSHPSTDKLYFSRSAGDSLLNFLRASHVPIGGRILDFGCGPGYLLEKMLARGIACSGADFSPQSLEAVKKRVGNNPLFGGVELLNGIPSSLPSKSIDTLFLIETVEHILDDELDAALGECARLLKPGGVFIVTTPNEEDLEASEAICPDCGGIFHRMQHVRRWDRNSLSSLLTKYQLDVVLCKAVYLQPTRLRRTLAALVARAIGKRLPHLIYVGRKKTQGI